MRAVLLGCGSHGGEVLLPAALSAGIHVAALVDADLTRAKDLARRWSVPAAYPSLAAMHDLAEIDAVIIALPVAEHTTHVAWALARGLHVFVEKPPGADLSQVRELTAQVADADLICSVGMNFRCAQGVQALRALISSGRYGAPASVRVTQVARKPLVPFSPGLSLEASLFYAQGIHAIDLALLLGPSVTRIEGHLLPLKRGRHFVMVGQDEVSGCRVEASFGSSSAALYHQVEVVLDAGGVLSLRDLSELVYLPQGGEVDVSEYPGSRVLWRRSPTSVGYASAGYATELASFQSRVQGEGADPCPDAADLADLVPVYDAFDQVLTGGGLKWTA